MTEQIQDQVSAFVDDELSTEECSFFVRRLERDTETRAQMVRYATIGAALRGELFHPDPEMLRRRLQASLSGAPVGDESVEPQAGTATGLLGRARLGIVKPLAGVAIAASVATMAIGLLRVETETALPDPAALQARSQLEELELDGLPSYVVPPGSSEQRIASPELRLTNYLVRHGEYAPGIGRTVVHSNVMVHTADGAGDQVEGNAE